MEYGTVSNRIKGPIGNRKWAFSLVTWESSLFRISVCRFPPTHSHTSRYQLPEMFLWKTIESQSSILIPNFPFESKTLKLSLTFSFFHLRVNDFCVSFVLVSKQTRTSQIPNTEGKVGENMSKQEGKKRKVRSQRLLKTRPCTTHTHFYFLA